jgi:hypothetical protein
MKVKNKFIKKIFFFYLFNKKGSTKNKESINKKKVLFFPIAHPGCVYKLHDDH